MNTAQAALPGLTPAAADLKGDVFLLPHAAMRGEFKDAHVLMQFLQAGKAVFTVRSSKSGERLTFMLERPKQQRAGQDAKPIFVSVLSGADNTSQYTFIGTIFPNEGEWSWRHSYKSHVTNSAASAKVIAWLVHCINTDRSKILTQAQVWHEGRCGRCGRKLTVPESIESGFGPECISKMKGG